MSRIAVYADWSGLRSPQRLGFLHARCSGAQELFEFEFDQSVLADPLLSTIQLDPRLGMYAGHQYPERGRSTFGVFADSSPVAKGVFFISVSGPSELP